MMKRTLFVLCFWAAAWAQQPGFQHDFEVPQRRADGMPLGIERFGVGVHQPKIVRKIPHDPQSFTQGLCFDSRGRLFESCGGYQRSNLRELDVQSGRVLRQTNLSKELWAEGCCPVGAELLLLTWQNRRFFFFDQTSLQQTDQFEHFGEGWGVAPYGEQVAFSDGGSTLQFFQPKPWRKESQITVNESGRPIDLLNELESVEERIYCNVWPSDYIAIIDPETGSVGSWLSGHALLSEQEQAKCDVLNGIAYDPRQRLVYLTGKLWPWIFVVEPP